MAALQCTGSSVGTLRYMSTPLPANPLQLRHNVRAQRQRRSAATRVAATQQEEGGLVARFPDAFRALPLIAGATGIAGVVANRVASGIAPVVSAGSAQSRADVLVIVMSAVLVLTGLQWLSLKPKDPQQVELEGEQVAFYAPGLPKALLAELQWAWDALRTTSRARCLVLFHRGRCLMHLGVAPAGQAPGAAAPGPICQQAMKSGTGNYLANLVLFPGRLEFAPYLPANCQAALIQPVGPQSVLVIGSDTQRGFTRLDQAWASAVAEKLEVQLERLGPGSGFKQPS
ncbi:hypothetical protein ABPG77_002357 [Micractinium sp. CCAP 211/92]